MNKSQISLNHFSSNLLQVKRRMTKLGWHYLQKDYRNQKNGAYKIRSRGKLLTRTVTIWLHICKLKKEFCIGWSHLDKDVLTRTSTGMVWVSVKKWFPTSSWTIFPKIQYKDLTQIIWLGRNPDEHSFL